MKYLHIAILVIIISGCTTTPSLLSIGDEGNYSYYTRELEPNVFNVDIHGAGIHRHEDTKNAFVAKAQALCGGEEYKIDHQTYDYHYWSSGFRYRAPRTFGNIQCTQAVVSVFDIPEPSGTTSSLFEQGKVGRIYIIRHYPGADVWGEPIFLEGKKIANLRPEEYSVVFIPEGDYTLVVKDKEWSSEERKKVRFEHPVEISIKNGQSAYVLFSYVNGRKRFQLLDDKNGKSWARNLNFKESFIIE
ncbi:hypothetical protein [Aurantivibrio plasticivorans]